LLSLWLIEPLALEPVALNVTSSTTERCQSLDQLEMRLWSPSHTIRIGAAAARLKIENPDFSMSKKIASTPHGDDTAPANPLRHAQITASHSVRSSRNDAHFARYDNHFERYDDRSSRDDDPRSRNDEHSSRNDAHRERINDHRSRDSDVGNSECHL
jgi:hypothetical protein